MPGKKYKIIGHFTRKWIILLILLAITGKISSAQESILQEKLSIQANNQPLYEVLIGIGNNLDINFSYNADLIDDTRLIRERYTNKKLVDILDNILQDTSLMYTVVGSQIVIHSKEENPSIRHKLQKGNDSTGYVIIRGRVVDKKTLEALAYANVAVVDREIGTVTNEEGVFILKIPQVYLDEEIGVSFIGYENYYMAIEELAGLENLITLEPSIFSIQEVIIRLNDPVAIIQSAVRRIDENYYTEPYLTTGFYRESITNKEKYMLMLEAVLEVYKYGYTQPREDRMRVLKSRKNINISVEDTVMLKLKAGLETALRLDIIKYPPSFLREAYFPFYSYKMKDIVSYDDGTAYLISFKPEVEANEILFKGELYIDVNTLAIVAAEYYVDRNAIERSDVSFIVKKQGFGTRVKQKRATYHTNYRNINGIYYLNHVRGKVEFSINKRKEWFSKDFLAQVEMVFNTVDTIGIEKIRYKDMVNTRTIFAEQMLVYDKAFWGKENFIPPEKPLNEAMENILLKIEELKTEQQN